jgi:predicted aconitase
MALYLTKEQERMLAGEYGEVLERNFRLLVRLGDIYGADRMIPVGSVQVAGVSYKSIGDPGLEFLEDLAEKGAKVKVPTTLNPPGMDLKDWRQLGFPEDFAEKQLRIIEAFRRMGVMMTATCTPYLVGNLPRFREHLAWSESSAVSFANSVVGARTNREGGPSALAAALCGVTPNYGLHLDENREPTIVINVEVELKHEADFGALGYHVGKVIEKGVPYFKGIKQASVDQLKALGAAMAASGSIALYHVEGLTPEAELVKVEGLERLGVDEEELEKAYEELNTGEEPDIAILGCPHASLREISELAEKLKGKRLRKPLWICTARATKRAASEMGLVDVIEAAGGKVVADTCAVVAPIERMGFRCTAVNSGKAASYLPGFCKQAVVFKSIDEILGMMA